MNLFVNSRFRWRPPTGVERHAHEVLRRLAPTIEVLPPESFSKGSKSRLWEQSVLAQVARNGVLYSPANSGPIAHPRHLLTVHDIGPIDMPGGYAKSLVAIFRAELKAHCRATTSFLTVSEFSRARIVEEFGIEQERVRVVGNGVSDDFRPVGTNLSGGRPYFLSVGAIGNPNKNLATILDAWRIAGRRDCDLVIVGKQRPNHAFSAEDLDFSTTRFLGDVEDQHLAQLYTGADALIHVPNYEGFSLTPLEAAACGTQSICSDIPAIRETAPNAVFVPIDAEAIAVEISRFRPENHPIDAESAKRLHSWDVVASRVRTSAVELGANTMLSDGPTDREKAR